MVPRFLWGFVTCMHVRCDDVSAKHRCLITQVYWQACFHSRYSSRLNVRTIKNFQNSVARYVQRSRTRKLRAMTQTWYPK
ncbi:hypothetical protein B0T09DRAFT_190079 [Sordaria sp. MPI-SDFR-AT-0083]|nr:hypothetical protein B0T09DRAFT_190079 [Sordaria sp. MPI-SDFR-AT-0083]